MHVLCEPSENLILDMFRPRNLLSVAQMGELVSFLDCFVNRVRNEDVEE